MDGRELDRWIIGNDQNDPERIRVEDEPLPEVGDEKDGTKRECPNCGADLEQYGIGEHPSEECTACGRKEQVPF